MRNTHQNYPVTRDGWSSVARGEYFVHTHADGEIYAHVTNVRSIEAVAFREGRTIDLRWFDSVAEAKAAVLAA